MDRLASTAFMPKGIGDKALFIMSWTLSPLGLNGLHAERHW